MAKTELDAIKNTGIVGAGGGGFPTHVKLGSSAQTLIINAAECEPLINVDKQLLEHYFERVLKGIKIASALIEAKEVMSKQGLDLDNRHLMLVADLMTFTGDIRQIAAVAPRA